MRHELEALGYTVDDADSWIALYCLRPIELPVKKGMHGITLKHDIGIYHIRLALQLGAVT